MYTISHTEQDISSGQFFQLIVPSRPTLAFKPYREHHVSYPYTISNGFSINNSSEKMYKVYSLDKNDDVKIKRKYFSDKVNLQKYTKYLTDNKIEYSIEQPNKQNLGGETSYIYILANPFIENVLYINVTSIDVWIEANDLSDDTGVPSPFIVIFKRRIKNYDDAVFYLEYNLNPFRIDPRKNFFDISLAEVQNIISMYEE